MRKLLENKVEKKIIDWNEIRVKSEENMLKQ